MGFHGRLRHKGYGVNDMAENWFDVVRDGAYDALCAAFRVDPDAEESMARFVPAYLEDATTPQAPRDFDVCYFAVTERQGATSDYVTQQVENSMLKLKTTVPANVLFTFYGPNADRDAEQFWKILPVDFGYDSPRAVLRRSRIVLDGMPSRPVSIFEVEGTFHRRRCDVSVDVAYLDIFEMEIPTVEVAPEIIVQEIVAARPPERKD